MDVICMDSATDKAEEMGNSEKIKSIERNKSSCREKSRKSSADHENKENEPLVDRNLLKLDLLLVKDNDDDDSNMEQNMIESMHLDQDEEVNHNELNNFIKNVCGKNLAHFHQDFNEKQKNCEVQTTRQGLKFPVKNIDRRSAPELGGGRFPVHFTQQFEQPHAEAAVYATNSGPLNCCASNSFETPGTRIDDDDIPSTSRSAAVGRSDDYNETLYQDEDSNEENVLRYIKEQDDELLMRQKLYPHLDFKEKNHIHQKPTVVQHMKFPVNANKLSEFGNDIFPVKTLENFEKVHVNAFVKALDNDLQNIFQS